VEGIKFWMNFAVENSNKLPKNGFRRENELSVFTLGANNTCYLIYPWRKVVFLFCHNDISQTTMFWIMLWNLSSKKFQWIGVHQLGLECLDFTMWYLLITLNHFFIEKFEKSRLKTILEFGGILGIVGKSSPSLI
jgi:hypothetical protein